MRNQENKMEYLTDHLAKILLEVHEGKIEIELAKVQKGIVGTMISGNRAQLTYNLSQQKFPNMTKIKFFEGK
tara:strand:+ start:60 stop:275 length:216 start_codon:yes stop_codon:yes gene_type:complete